MPGLQGNQEMLFHHADGTSANHFELWQSLHSKLLPSQSPFFNLHPFIFLISHLFSALFGFDTRN
jgi:hypothetical protein